MAPAGGWFAAATSAGMGGALGTAAVATAAATGGLAIAAGAGYGIYKLSQKIRGNKQCPWCNRTDTDTKENRKYNNNNRGRSERKVTCFGDNVVTSDEEMLALAIK